MRDELKMQIAALAPRLRRFAYALCGDREEGDDLVQSACLKAIDRIDQFQSGTRLDSWLFRIVQTTFLDERRARSRRGGPGDPDAVDRLSDHGLGARSAEDRLTLERVRGAIAALPEEQRAVMILVAIEGYSYKEAASALETPVGTVMSRLSRARARLLPMVRELAS